MTGLLTALHATVDGLCACCVFLMVSVLEFDVSIKFFLLYNILAFLTQPLVGWWMDHHHFDVRYLILSVALLLSGGALCLANQATDWSYIPFIVVALIGTGNSIFHVYGGKRITDSTHNDIRHLGIFVSMGALGLFLGERHSSEVGILLISFLMASLTAIYLFRYRKGLPNAAKVTHKSESEIHLTQSSAKSLFAFILLIVFFRSFIGKMVPPGASADIPFFALFSVLIAVLGKALGGFIALKIAEWRTLVITLLLTGICFLLGHYAAVFILLMMLFINFSMPITLHIANQLLPRREGFAFGMLAAMLAPGVGLGIICTDNPWSYNLIYPLIATMVIEAIVLLCFHERRWEVLSLSVVMNIVTNLPLNLVALFVLEDITIPMIILLEGIVFLVESWFYFLVTHSWRKSITYSLACNLTSYLSGVLFQLL